MNKIFGSFLKIYALFVIGQYNCREEDK